MTDQKRFLENVKSLSKGKLEVSFHAVLESCVVAMRLRIIKKACILPLEILISYSRTY